MAFKLSRDTYNAQTERILLTNGITVNVGDVIVPVSGATNTATNATASVTGDVYVLGVVQGFSKANGEVIGQGQNPSVTPNQLTTSATNTTVEQYYAVYMPIHKEQVWEADFSAAIGTTAPGTVMTWYNLSDARTVNESSEVDITAASAPLQVLYVQAHPTSTTKGFVRFGKCLYARP